MQLGKQLGSVSTPPLQERLAQHRMVCTPHLWCSVFWQPAAYDLVKNASLDKARVMQVLILQSGLF